jgi:hypothetical protein
VNAKKKLKYDENKKVELVDDVNRYNEIGLEEIDGNGKIKIDEKKLVVKKTIAVPETKNDDTYYDLIKSKRQSLEELTGLKGYVRCMLEDVLPNPDLYECTDADLEFLREINFKVPTSQQVKVEDFERVIEVWETEIGLVVTHEKRRNGACPADHNKIDLEKAKSILKDPKDSTLLSKEQQQTYKELGPFLKSSNFNVLVEEIYRVANFLN